METASTPQQNKQNVLPVLLVVVAVAAGLFVRSGNGKKPVPQTPTPPMQATASPVQSGDVKVVSVEAGSFYFKPNELRVKVGQKVKIELKSVSMMHDFVIDELGVRMPVVKNGESGTVEFTAEKIGTFEYYCSVGQHRKMGQVGKLIVE